MKVPYVGGGWGFGIACQRQNRTTMLALANSCLATQKILSYALAAIWTVSFFAFLPLPSLLFFNSFPPLSLFNPFSLSFSLLLSPLATWEGDASENKKRICKISFPTVQRCMGCCQQEVGAKCTNFILLLSDYNSWGTHPDYWVNCVCVCVCVCMRLSKRNQTVAMTQEAKLQVEPWRKTRELERGNLHDHVVKNN